VIVFKHEKDFMRTFDLSIFHNLIFTKFVDKARKDGVSDVEKELKGQNYAKAIEEYFDFED
jgi:hypothetical protein